MTRRTATSALLRERSINFCRLRTFFRSPARDAAKIRCLSRRTSPSTWRHTTPIPVERFALGSVHRGLDGCDLGRLQRGCGVQLAPSVPASSIIESPQAHPTRVSTLSGPGISPYPAGYAGTAGGGASIVCSRFPVAFRLPALASRVVLRPPRSSAFLTVGPPDEHSSSGPRRGCHVPHETDTTGLDALCTPGTVVRSRPARSLRAAPATSQWPAPISH